MPLYCYIVETGMYEDVRANILGHTNKYSQEEFDNLVIEVTEKYGDVEEIEYTVQATLEHVEEIRYKINPTELIRHLVIEYGFVELEIPVNDGVNSREISKAPVPTENLMKYVVKTPKCPENKMEYAVKKDFPKPEYVNCRGMLNEFMPVMANTKEDNSKKPYVDCVYCDYHDYDWRDDGDEFEVCHKGHELYPKECEDFEEL